MSRVFAGAASEGSVASVNSSAQVSAFSGAAWINIAAYQAGGTVFVKDPVSGYWTYLEVLSDGTLYGASGTAYLGSVNLTTVIAGGSGYAHLDTGFLVGNNPDIPANRASYSVNSLSGSAVATVGIPASGTGFAVGQTYTTVIGGSQPGSGNGALTLRVDSIINQANANSQSVETVSTGVWTHVAMTWDANGDGLVHLYINGVECTYQGQRTASIHPDTSTGPIYIGDDTFDSTLDGAVAEFAVFGNTALNGAQVASLAASTTGVPAPLLGFVTDYWHLCGLTSPEPNVVNPSNTGTVTNAAGGANSPGYTSCSAGPHAGGGGFSTMTMTASGSPQEATGPSRNAIMRRRTRAMSMS